MKPSFIPLPPFAVTSTSPEAPSPTIAVIEALVIKVKEVAATPPNFTPVTSLKPVPEITIFVPALAAPGEKELMVGGAIKANPPVVAVPPGVLTVMPALLEPGATTAVMLVAELTTNDVAPTGPNLTAKALVKLVPVRFTVVPAAPVEGLNAVIVGGLINVKPAAVAVPLELVTVMLPELPLPTVAFICVLL